MACIYSVVQVFYHARSTILQDKNDVYTLVVCVLVCIFVAPVRDSYFYPCLGCVVTVTRTLVHLSRISLSFLKAYDITFFRASLPRHISVKVYIFFQCLLTVRLMFLRGMSLKQCFGGLSGPLHHPTENDPLQGIHYLSPRWLVGWLACWSVRRCYCEGRHL